MDRPHSELMIYKYVTVGHQHVKSYFAIILNEISLNTSFRKLQCFVSPPNSNKTSKYCIIYFFKTCKSYYQP